MKILVCVKPVPDPEKYGQLRIDEKTKRLVRDEIPSVINPSDRNALEEALRIRDKYGSGSMVAVISMAAESARERLTECLAMGADEAYLISDSSFGGADTYATSYVLAEAAKRISCEFDLILAGNESADGATSHVPVQLAEWLELPHICRVNRLEISGDTESGYRFKAWKKTEDGRLVFEGRLPCVVAVTVDINKPRLINAMGIIKAKKKPLNIWDNSVLALETEAVGITGSPTQAGELISPDIRRTAAELGSEPDKIAAEIVEIIKKAGV